MYVESKLIEKGSGDVDIGCGNAFGGEADAEGGVDSGVEKVNNIIEGFQYTETSIPTVGELKKWIVDYCNALVLKLREKGKPKVDIH